MSRVASTPSAISIRETSVCAAADGESDSTVMDVSRKTPLSTLKREEVREAEADGRMKLIVEKMTLPVVGLIVKMGAVLMDATFFFVPAGPDTVNG